MPGIIAGMTERALPGMDGAPACPFVAFGDDREGRSTSPDHRHRCFAESPPAPRAVAHQEAYCLSSAFPVCPTFQDWARREAAHARGVGERPETAPTAMASSSRVGSVMDEPTDEPDRVDREDPPVTRNPPRDWAAPPPWAAGAAGAAGAGGGAGAGGAARSSGSPAGIGGGAAGSPAGSAGEAASSGTSATRPPEGQGLAGSPADLLAGGVVASGTVWSASAAGSVSTAPDDELAGLVQGRSTAQNPYSSETPAAPPTRPASDGYPPSTRTGRRPSVSSTRPAGDAVPGPTWEHSRRYEAYPTIKTRVGMPGLPRVALLAGAVGIAALALFMLPALLGLGGGSSPSAKPSASVGAASAVPSATVKPGPTAQTYVVKRGDTMSKIASRFGVTVEAIMAVNPAITNPNKIALGQEIIIPEPASGPSGGPAAKPSAKPSTSALP